MTDTLGAKRGVDLVMERALENSLIGALGFADVAIDTLLGDPQCQGNPAYLFMARLPSRSARASRTMAGTNAPTSPPNEDISRISEEEIYE